jgi:hypothetical protein
MEGKEQASSVVLVCVWGGGGGVTRRRVGVRVEGSLPVHPRQAHKQLTCNTCYTSAVVTQQRHLGTAARDLHRQLKVDLQEKPKGAISVLALISINLRRRIKSELVAAYPVGIGTVAHR